MASFVPALARSSRRGAGRALARLAGVVSRGRSSVAANASSAVAASSGKAANASSLPPGSFGVAISRPWAEALVELSQPSSTDATLDLATGEGTCAFVVADAIEEAKIWGPPPGAGAPAPGLAASVLGLDKNRAALEKARQTCSFLDTKKKHAKKADDTESAKSVEVRFKWADACHADAPWHEDLKKRFARAYCAFGLNHFNDPETALRRVRETLVPGGTFVCSVWAPLSAKNQPLFYAAYLATAETIDEMEKRKAKSERWLVDAKRETYAHFSAPFDFIEPGGTTADENVRALDTLERMLIRAGFDAPDAAVERAGHARFENLERALKACVENLSFLDEMRDVDDGFFYQTLLETFEALLVKTAGNELVFEEGTSAFTVPSTAYFAHATAPWR